MNMSKVVAIIAISVLLMAGVPFVAADDENGIVITDSRGEITNLTQPATHVAAFGAFATNTLIDIGCLEKAVIFDSGSKYDKSGIVEVQNYTDNMFVTVSSSNKDMVVQKMLALVDNGTWNKTTDVILGYGFSYLDSTWDELEGLGFHVVTFYPTSYDGIVQVVQDIESIVGADHSVSEQMAYLKTYIYQTLKDNGINETSEKVTAVYASYSSNVLKLGNGGSVTVDFINYAGGVNIANDSSKATPTYAVDITAIIQMAPDYVLLDGYYTGTANDFSDMIGNDNIAVYKMNKTWNSYCPDAMTGLWTVACLFYPDYFEGDIPVETNDDGTDNTMLYAGVGVCIVVVAIAAVVATRKR